MNNYKNIQIIYKKIDTKLKIVYIKSEDRRGAICKTLKYLNIKKT